MNGFPVAIILAATLALALLPENDAHAFGAAGGHASAAHVSVASHPMVVPHAESVPHVSAPHIASPAEAAAPHIAPTTAAKSNWLPNWWFWHRSCSDDRRAKGECK